MTGYLITSLHVAPAIFTLFFFMLYGILIPFKEDKYPLILFSSSIFISLLITAFIINKELFKKIFIPLNMIVSACIIAYPLLTDFRDIFLILIGSLSAFLFMKGGLILSSAKDPLKLGAISLVVGNVLFILAIFIPLDLTIKFIIAGLSLIPLALKEPEDIFTDELPKNVLIHLPILFMFFIVYGIFHGTIHPIYREQAYLFGVEQFFYTAAVVLSIYIFRKYLDFGFVIGMVFGILSFTFFDKDNKFLVNLSMYLIQTSFGIVNLYIIRLFSESRNPIKSYGLGFGTVFMAHVLGYVFTIVAFAYTKYIVMVGNIFLGAGLIAVYTLFVRKQKQQIIYITETSEVENKNFGIHKHSIIEKFSIGLSNREKDVLRLIIDGKTIKEISDILDISESAVKTYLHRIYQKKNVSSKEELMEKLSELM